MKKLYALLLKPILTALAIFSVSMVMAQSPLNESLVNVNFSYNHQIGVSTNVIEKVELPDDASYGRFVVSSSNLGKYSKVIFTSLKDGETQELDAQQLKKWGNASAYFNGNEFTIQVIKDSRDQGKVFVNIDQVIAGFAPDQSNQSQCGSTDNRTLFTDDAIGRIVPIGCTGWLITNGKMVTAGHCATSSAQILEFNVPASNSNGSINHPPVADQFPINQSSSQSGASHDWAVFDLNQNSLGETALVRQGKSFNVVQGATTGNVSTVRITGFGVERTSNSPYDPERNQVSQTHTGALNTANGTKIYYNADTEGGNSGSPVIDEATGNAIGVHTHGGCSTSGGNNSGTPATLAEFWNAMGLGTTPPTGCGTTITSFPYAESFEGGLGAWTQGTGDNLDWTRNSGGTPSSSTGPTAASDGTYYMYVEASSPNYPSKRTYLDGPCFDLAGQSGATFTFDYHMYGATMGTLSVEAKPDGGSWTSVWSLSGDQGNSWQSASVDLSSYAGTSVQLRFNGFTGSSYTGDMTVDNVALTTGGTPSCDVPTGLASSSVAQTTFTLTWDAVSGAASYDVDVNGTVLSASSNSINITGATASTTYACRVRTNCSGATSAYSSAINVTTQAASGSCTGGISSFPYSESFESGLGSWSQGSGDDNDWTRDSGGTPSSGTGPSTGSAGSWYMYLETSGNGTGYPNKTAYFNSPCFNLSGQSTAAFGFDYHMNGTAMGTLNLQASNDNGATWTSIWNVSGSQGTAWQSASVNVNAYTGGSVQFRFLATSGSGWSSDIAIDNISVGDAGGPGGNSTVVLTLVTDQYGSETSWTLKDGSGTTVASGSGYGNNTTYTETFSLPAGCYDFTINDSYGDGICCTYGNGSYSLDEGSTTLASGGSFTSSETKNFCVTNESASLNESASFHTSVELAAYPNPASVEVNIRAAGMNNASFVVLDVTGRQVAQGTMTNGEASIALTTLKSGIYIVRATENDKVATTRFVKQ